MGFHSNSFIPTKLLDSDFTLESVLLCCLDLNSFDVSFLGEHGLFQTARAVSCSGNPVKPCIGFYAFIFMRRTCIIS